LLYLNLPPDVQVEPLYSSVAPVIGGILPPKAKAAVCVPQPAKRYLAVFKFVGLDVQVDPSYSSVAPVTGGTVPPKAKAAVCVPATS
jgi:hypothetical protein